MKELQVQLGEVHAFPTKRCPRCWIAKSWDEFASRGAGDARPSSYCRSCQRDYCKHHYAKNKDLHNKRRRRHQREYLIRNRQLMYAYLEHHPCVDCGNSNPIVLEFDHVRDQKTYDISTMARCCFSWKRILG